MSDLSEEMHVFTPFRLHEVHEKKPKDTNSPSQSILKPPTAVFPSNSAHRSGRRLTFAASPANFEMPGYTESSATPPMTTNQNGDTEKTQMIEVALSPVKTIRVSPDSWKAHLAYREFDDFANDTEKTDYTYSRLSPFHWRQIVPGITMRPNLSRPRLRSGWPPNPFTRTATSPITRTATSTTTPTTIRRQSNNSPTVRKMPGGLSSLQKKLHLLREDTFTSNGLWLLILLALIGGIVLAGLILNNLSSLRKNTISKEDSMNGLNKLIGKMQHLEQTVTKENERLSAVTQLLNDSLTTFKVISLTSSSLQHCCRLALLRLSEHGMRTDNAFKALRDKVLNLEDQVRLWIFNMTSVLAELRAQISNVRETSPIGHTNQIVRDSLKLYDGDKTGLVDFALESAGGRVASIRSTAPWPGPQCISFDPHQAIRSGMAPGECWAFRGKGHILLQLSNTIQVTGCSVEHIPDEIHPLGRARSAPKNFALKGLKGEDDTSPHVFGDYVFVYLKGSESETVQFFPVVNSSPESFQFVELVIYSNYGYEYTCLYRIRIHGNLV